MRRNSSKLSRRHKTWLASVTSLLFVSGAAWAWLHYFARSAGEFGEVANPAEPWMLKAHGAAAFAMLVMLGTLLPLHVRFGWHARRNRWSGAGMLGFLGLLTITGYGLYYIGGEHLRAWTSWLHLGLGLALPVMLAVHIWRGKKSSRVLAARDGQPSREIKST